MSASEDLRPPAAAIAEVTVPYELHNFTVDELIELKLLRDQKIDALVNEGFVPHKDRWNPEHRDGFNFLYPEMALTITTGEGYPVRPLDYELKNLTPPRVVIDQLQVALRGIHAVSVQENTLDKWDKRELCESGLYEFKMAALQITAQTMAHLKHYRSDPMYWKMQVDLKRTDYALSQERRLIAGYCHNFKDLLWDTDDERDIFDPLNPDWSKKPTDVTNEKKLDFSNVEDQSEVKNSMFGIDPSSVQGHDPANSILGKTPEEVCANIPETYRILHIESVVRSDLASRFFQRQEKIRKDLEKLQINILKGSLKRETRLEMGKRANEKETLVEKLVIPDMTFHCTREDLVPSIVRQGFLKPVKEGDIRCGSTYGQGIYSSPDPTFSLMYTRFRREPTKPNEFAGLKLIVCATITGICRYMTRDDGWRTQNTPYPGAHSHVANDLLEYVVFDESQIIPCYVIHLDLGRDVARYITPLSQDPTTYMHEYRERRRKQAHAWKKLSKQPVDPAEKKRREKVLLAKAQKYLPYGFVAASGSHFVVEDGADVSEDEEECGEYQKDRVDGAAGESADIWADNGHTTLALDSDGDFGDEDFETDGSEDLDYHSEDEGTFDWEYEMGPEGRTKFDEYFEARRAKNKKSIQTPKRSDW